MTSISVIFIEVYLNLGLAKWILISINNVHNLANDYALLFWMVHILQVHPLLVTLL